MADVVKSNGQNQGEVLGIFLLSYPLLSMYLIVWMILESTQVILGLSWGRRQCQLHEKNCVSVHMKVLDRTSLIYKVYSNGFCQKCYFCELCRVQNTLHYSLSKNIIFQKPFNILFRPLKQGGIYVGFFLRSLRFGLLQPRKVCIVAHMCVPTPWGHGLRTDRKDQILTTAGLPIF